MRVLSKVLFSACDCVHFKLARSFSINTRLLQNAEQLSIPRPDNEPEPVSPKIENLVNEISKLTLIEVSELSSVLKKRLNIPDAPVMAYGGFAPPAAASTEEEEDTAPQKAVKTSFNVKLVKFADDKKIALIKEVKSIISDMNLVQAKKFVESAPVIVKSDLSKEEADKLKETLEKIGGVCEIE